MHVPLYNIEVLYFHGVFAFAFGFGFWAAMGMGLGIAIINAWAEQRSVFDSMIGQAVLVFEAIAGTMKYILQAIITAWSPF